MVAAFALSAACAPASRYGTDPGPVAGSTPALQPRIDAATSAEDAHSSLEYVDLRGPDDDVLARFAQAVGSHTPGAWGASVTRPWTGGTPF